MTLENRIQELGLIVELIEIVNYKNGVINKFLVNIQDIF